jgi:hypothetical protein
MKTRTVCLVFLLIIWTIQGCAPTTRLNTVLVKDPLPSNCRPLVFLPGDQLPENYETVATVRHGDSGFSVSCGKEDIRVRMSAEACQAGANGILIKKEETPRLVSTCYRVTADFISY